MKVRGSSKTWWRIESLLFACAVGFIGCGDARLDSAVSPQSLTDPDGDTGASTVENGATDAGGDSSGGADQGGGGEALCTTSIVGNDGTRLGIDCTTGGCHCTEDGNTLATCTWSGADACATTPIEKGGIKIGCCVFSPPAVEDPPVPDPLPPVSGGGTSGGSGGQTGYYQTTYSANGLTGEYKIDAPKDIGPGKPYGMLIYLHGDGGGDYREIWGFLPLTIVAQKHGLFLLSVQSPNGGVSWYEGGLGNARWLHDLLQNEIFRKYNIDKEQIFFNSASGGSVFFTGFFLPTYGPSYRGGAIPRCGGATSFYPFWGGPVEFTRDPGFIRSYRMYFYAGTADFLFSEVKRSVEYYDKSGIAVESEYPAGVTHCGGESFSLVDRVLAKWLGHG